VLQATQAPPVAANHGPGVGSSTPAPPNHGASVEHRLAAPESAAGDLETVTMGPQTFKSIQDCETFICASVPGAVLDTCAMSRDLVNHPLAMMLFGVLVTTGLLQWHQLAVFISERCATSLHQIEDPKEAWLFTAEIVKGVFAELHKIRVIAADRTSATHNHKDAARSLWVAALQTQRLMAAEFITLKFVGQPKLSLCSVNHLFCHRVPLKMVETVASRVAKVENDVRSITVLQNKMKAKHPV
jgi:hypothetical protein